MARNTDLFQSPADLIPFIFRIQDNGGRTADRYTVAFCDGDYLAMSGGPTHPQGVSMWGERFDPEVFNDDAETGAAIDLSFYDLPEHIRAHVIARCNEGFRDFMEVIESEIPKGRNRATVNDGTHRCTGDGLYRANGKYFVRLDSRDPDDDRGPYDTAREAMLASLPDDYGLSGPEYHSPIALDSPASPERAAAIKALEGVADAAWRESRGY